MFPRLEGPELRLASRPLGVWTPDDQGEKARMNVVIVESAAKAKTINKYLGSGYKVIASFGHVRDLPKSQLHRSVSTNRPDGLPQRPA
jgi:hypothetical protein